MDIKKEYERWLANATADADVAAELKTLDDAKVEDSIRLEKCRYIFHKSAVRLSAYFAPSNNIQAPPTFLKAPAPVPRQVPPHPENAVKNAHNTESPYPLLSAAA